MADIATFTNRDSVVNAVLRTLGKEGINITLPSSQNASLPDTEEVKCFIYKTRLFNLMLTLKRHLGGKFLQQTDINLLDINCFITEWCIWGSTRQQSEMLYSAVWSSECVSAQISC